MLNRVRESTSRRARRSTSSSVRRRSACAAAIREPGALAGTVALRSFSGARVQYVVKLADGVELIAETASSGRNAALATDTRVGFADDRRRLRLRDGGRGSERMIAAAHGLMLIAPLVLVLAAFFLLPVLLMLPTSFGKYVPGAGIAPGRLDAGKLYPHRH